MTKNLLQTTLAAGLVCLLGTGTAAAATLKDTIRAAEQQFAGEAIEAELYRERGRQRVEVELLSGNLLIEAVFDVQSGALVESEAYGNPRRIARVKRALARAQISLAEAIQRAENAAGPGTALEVELQVRRRANRNGRRYLVEYRSNRGEIDIIVNSRTGRVIRIERD